MLIGEQVMLAFDFLFRFASFESKLFARLQLPFVVHQVPFNSNGNPLRPILLILKV
jgi:hypothetical protein